MVGRVDLYLDHDVSPKVHGILVRVVVETKVGSQILHSVVYIIQEIAMTCSGISFRRAGTCKTCKARSGKELEARWISIKVSHFCLVREAERRGHKMDSITFSPLQREENKFSVRVIALCTITLLYWQHDSVIPRVCLEKSRNINPASPQFCQT